MERKKICFVITTRGNYAKLKSVLAELQDYEDLEAQLIVAGGALIHNYGNIARTVKNQGLRVDREIFFLVEGENPVTMAKSAGLAIVEFTTAFSDLRPDMVVVIADRFESLSIAIAATYLNIPIAHMEGGEISGSIDESIRHAISKLAHLHFPANTEASERIERMGEAKETIFTVGGTSLDVIADMDLDNLEPVMELQSKAGVGPVVDLAYSYLVVIQHPVTTEYEQNRHNIDQTIGAIQKLQMPTIWIWPNMDAGTDVISHSIRQFRETERPSYCHFFTSLAIEYYAPLLRNTACIVGNSSSGIREAAFLGTPSVNIGSRQNGRMRCNNVLDCRNDIDEIVYSIQYQLTHGRYIPNHAYGDGKAGSKIAKILSETTIENVQKQNTY